MKALIFNGALERRSNSTAERISSHLRNAFDELSVEAEIYNMADSGVPLFDITLNKTPLAVEIMNNKFREADVHVWLTPLYHGSMTGVMKNCLDWLEYSAKLPSPYLTGKMVGMSCWADGVQAMQGINAMDAVGKALRAWTVPFSVPIQRNDLFESDGKISRRYQENFQLLLQLLLLGPNKVPFLS